MKLMMKTLLVSCGLLAATNAMAEPEVLSAGNYFTCRIAALKKAREGSGKDFTLVSIERFASGPGGTYIITGSNWSTGSTQLGTLTWSGGQCAIDLR